MKARGRFKVRFGKFTPEIGFVYEKCEWKLSSYLLLRDKPPQNGATENSHFCTPNHHSVGRLGSAGWRFCSTCRRGGVRSREALLGWNMQDGPVTGLVVDAARRFGARLRPLWPPCGLSMWLGLLTAWRLGSENEIRSRRGLLQGKQGARPRREPWDSRDVASARSC